MKKILFSLIIANKILLNPPENIDFSNTEDYWTTLYAEPEKESGETITQKQLSLFQKHFFNKKNDNLYKNPMLLLEEILDANTILSREEKDKILLLITNTTQKIFKNFTGKDFSVKNTKYEEICAYKRINLFTISVFTNSYSNIMQNDKNINKRTDCIDAAYKVLIPKQIEAIIKKLQEEQAMILKTAIFFSLKNNN